MLILLPVLSILKLVQVKTNFFRIWLLLNWNWWLSGLLFLLDLLKWVYTAWVLADYSLRCCINGPENCHFGLSWIIFFNLVQFDMLHINGLLNILLWPTPCLALLDTIFPFGKLRRGGFFLDVMRSSILNKSAGCHR
jgi:hypothetical protein